MPNENVGDAGVDPDEDVQNINIPLAGLPEDHSGADSSMARDNAVNEDRNVDLPVSSRGGKKLEWEDRFFVHTFAGHCRL